MNHNNTKSTTQIVWQQLREDPTAIPIEQVWDAYCENLNIVLSHVEKLLPDLSGKTVISPDHGNMIGERLRPIPTRRKYDHFYGVYASELVQIPWFVLESKSRPEIRSDLLIKWSSSSQQNIDRQLQALGYQ